MTISVPAAVVIASKREPGARTHNIIMYIVRQRRRSKNQIFTFISTFFVFFFPLSPLSAAIAYGPAQG